MSAPPYTCKRGEHCCCEEEGGGDDGGVDHDGHVEKGAQPQPGQEGESQQHAQAAAPVLPVVWCRGLNLCLIALLLFFIVFIIF